jgi:uncharacterized Zn-binding protein involved in type VI secretion
MPLAARITDMVAHGTALAPGPGSFDVLIGGMPAWRVAVDMHTCPLLTVLIPHVGGVIPLGSTTVFINSLPAARQGDAVVEVGPPNPIVGGCPNVLIG